MKVRGGSVYRATEDPDRLTLAALEDLPLSEGWQLFVKRLGDMRTKASAALVAEKDPTEMFRLQGQIAALERAIALPGILKDEAAQKLKRAPRL